MEIWGHRSGSMLEAVGFSWSLPVTRECFPLLGTEEETRLAFEDIKWLISGETDVRRLQNTGLTCYNKKVVDGKYDLGRYYGYQIRHFGGDGTGASPGVDQFSRCIEQLREIGSPQVSPRNILITLVNPAESNQFPTCVTELQFVPLMPSRQLTLIVRMRAALVKEDYFSKNLVMFAFLLWIVCSMTNFSPKRVVFQIGVIQAPDGVCSGCVRNGKVTNFAGGGETEWNWNWFVFSGWK